MSEINLLIIAVVAVGAGILLIKFGQVIARFLLVLGGLIVAGIIGLAFLEQARATRAVAATASIAATGQAATSASLAVIVILVLFFLVAGAGWRRTSISAASASGPAGSPAPMRTGGSPYAYWGQSGQSLAPPDTRSLRRRGSLSVLAGLLHPRPTVLCAALSLSGGLAGGGAMRLWPYRGGNRLFWPGVVLLVLVLLAVSCDSGTPASGGPVPPPSRLPCCGPRWSRGRWTCT
jgi:hypothetical protein